MIRASHGTLKMLRAGRAEILTLTGEVQPVAIGRDYVLLAPATDDFKREKLRAMVVACEPNGEGWRVTFRYGIATEQPRFLKARPGGMEGDYTTHASKAARDEPEPVDQATLTRFEKDARTAEQVRADYERRAVLDGIEEQVARLESIGRDDDRGRIQGLRASLRRLRNAA